MEATIPDPVRTALIERLQAVGLEERDAHIYAHLCVHGPTKASEIASAARLNRTEAYRSLEALMRRGFVTASLDRPALYEATPPEKVFDDALAQHQAQRAQIERARDHALTVLRDLREGAPASPLKSSYRMLQGRAAIYTAADAMLRRARVSQAMVSSSFTAATATDANGPYARTLERAREGLAQRLLLRETPGIFDALREAVASPRVELRYFEPQGHIRFTIVDDREILIWLATDPSPSLHAREDVAMWTNAPDFVLTQRVLYEALWNDARPVRGA